MHARTASLVLAAALTLAASVAGATTLYDPALGTLPAAQGWATFPAGNQGVGGGLLSIDTTADNAIQVGNSRFDTALDTLAGYTLDVRLRVVSESHADADRAGFSIINIGADQTSALEIAFWDDELWFYDESFTRRDPIGYTAGVFHDFSFRFANGLLDVFIDGASAASGLPTYDYCKSGCSLFVGAVYNTPNHVFFGDDTSSAGAHVEIASLAVTPVPLPGPLLLLAAGLTGLGAFRRRAVPRRAAR